jgi:putative ATP-dependent RNA helicase RhlE
MHQTKVLRLIKIIKKILITKRNGSKQQKENMYFDELDLNDDVLDALYDMHFDKCTPVQEKCIPLILKGKDILAVAQTGTGKTAAYLLPILSKLAKGNYADDAINCVIMSPTRELAQQIDQAIQGFSYYINGISCVAVYGGNDGNRYDQEIKSLSMGANIVIATPGRLISHISLGNVDLSKVSFFVLDEADRMLDMGFSEDIKMIANNLPKSCQTIMFSATMPNKIESLAKSLLKNAEIIKLAVSKPAEKIQQSAYICYETQKIGIIKEIFKSGNLKRVIIFSGSKQKVKKITASLNKQNIKCGEMHSDLDQAQRDDVMFKFKSSQIDVLVATDIVARGIDIDDIAMVINYDVPHDVEDYVHRIGRTARADREGNAITFVSEEDIYYFRHIESFLEKTIDKKPLPKSLGDGPKYNFNSKAVRSKKAKNHKNNNKIKNNNKEKKNNNCQTKQQKDNQLLDVKKNDRSNTPTINSKINKKQEENKGEVVNINKDQNSKHTYNNNNKTKQKKYSKDNKKEQNITGNDKPSGNKGKTKVASNNTKPKRKRSQKLSNQEKQNIKRSTKYDIREDISRKYTSKEKGIKALLKKPLKWLKGLSKK